MRILILSDRIPPENAGGAEKVAWSVARGLREAGHEVHVIAATEKPYFEEVREDIPTYHIPVHYPARFQAYLSLYNPQVAGLLKTLYRRIQPDIVNTFNIHGSLTYYSLTLAHRMGIPTVFNSQDVMAFSTTKLTHYVNADQCEYPSEAYRLPPLYNFRQMRLRYNPLRNLIIRYILRHHADVRIAGSEIHRQTLEANGLPPFRVIYGSVPEDDFELDAAAKAAKIDALNTRLDLQGKRIILFAGRLTLDKGSQQLLAALERVVKDVPDVILLTLTRATLKQQGLDTPEYRHLQKYICIGGWMQGEELAAAYHASDVVVAPSTCMDTFPTVNLEAMACAKPVIATCFGGSAEAVMEGETGYIINPFDIETFANRLRLLLMNPEQAAEMGLAGYQRYQAFFTPQVHAKNMLEVYQGFLDGKVDEF